MACWPDLKAEKMEKIIQLYREWKARDDQEDEDDRPTIDDNIDCIHDFVATLSRAQLWAAFEHLHQIYEIAESKGQ